MSSRTVSSTLFYLCKIRKLRRLPFSTKWGKVVYHPQTYMKIVWQYCFDNDLIPKTTQWFFEEMYRKNAISTVELYDMGIDLVDVRAWIDIFTKQWRIFKIKRVGSFNIFYRNEDDLEEYYEQNKEMLKNLQQKEMSRREREGKIFEDIIERFYQSQGFQTQRNLWFQTEDLEKLEIDILCSKKFFNFEKERPILICVECKSWQSDRNIYSLTEFLNYYCRVKRVFPSALIHIWSYHYSHYFFKPSFLKKFPDVTLYYSKHIREAFKLPIKLFSKQ